LTGTGDRSNKGAAFAARVADPGESIFPRVDQFTEGVEQLPLVERTADKTVTVRDDVVKPNLVLQSVGCLSSP
ncbi:hypothetical protein CCR95_13955, partial [Thiocystis minor]|uniref:hypothetical protein n=1 Tax=Thiocystis minor TaxID=61597 RepID=UPI001A90CF36